MNRHRPGMSSHTDQQSFSTSASTSSARREPSAQEILNGIKEAKARLEAIDRFAPPPIVKLVANPLLMEDGEPVETPRSWKERLFTLPWHPLRATKTVIPKVPSPTVYITGDGTVFAHPETASKMREMFPVSSRIPNPLYPGHNK